MRNTAPDAAARRTHYTATARGLHWMTAAAVLALATLGLWIGYFEPADEAFKLRLYNIHESLGVTLLLVTVLRLMWRLRHPPPPIHPPLPTPLRVAAHANHAGLYVLLLAQPVVGLLATNAWGFPLTAWGVIPIPALIAGNEALAPRLSTLHAGIALALGLLVLLHAAAALWHHFIRRDDTLRRML